MEDDASAHCGTVSSRGRQVGGVRGVQSCQGAVAAEFLRALHDAFGKADFRVMGLAEMTGFVKA